MKLKNELFTIRGELPKRIEDSLMLIGIMLLVLVWAITSKIFYSPVFPSPLKVLSSFKELHFEDALIRNLFFSIRLNILGYTEAMFIAIPIGFIIGLFPITKGLFSKPVDAMRFVPLTAVTGLFIVWFGIEIPMKVHFLAFGIIVYLLPVVVQRISEVDKVYEQTAMTLGASRWQMVVTVFIPAVISKISDDIRVLVAISWTYIIVAELVNKTGGVGGLIYTSARQSRIDKVFAILLLIIGIGFFQDKLLSWLDRVVFKFKHI